MELVRRCLSFTKTNDGAFEVEASTLWQALPLDFRSAVAVDSLKRQLKAHLFKQALVSLLVAVYLRCSSVFVLRFIFSDYPFLVFIVLVKHFLSRWRNMEAPFFTRSVFIPGSGWFGV